MRFYLAPMEALTGYIYRNAYKKYFNDADRCFTPFIVGKKLSSKEKKEVCPENNTGLDVVPQILTNKSEDFICVAKILHEQYGYNEVNFNLGCPSGTVVSKHRGSGFLNVLDDLKRFLDEIFSATEARISIKTRTGVENDEDFIKIIELYNEYPLSELIVHPRCRVDGYVKPVNLEDFALAVKYSKHKLCYNGDINTVEDFNRIHELFPTVENIMCGRGVLANPGLFSECKGKPAPDKQTLLNFITELYLGYKAVMPGDKNVMFKMKELWIYFSKNFDDPKKVLNTVRRADTCAEYEIAVKKIFSEE